MTAATFWFDGFIVIHVCFPLFASNHLTHGVDVIPSFIIMFYSTHRQKTFNDNIELDIRRHLEIAYNKFPAKTY